MAKIAAKCETCVFSETMVDGVSGPPVCTVLTKGYASAASLPNVKPIPVLEARAPGRFCGPDGQLWVRRR